RMHLLLNVDRRGLDYEVAPVLFVFTAPNQLRIEVAVATLIRDADWGLFVLLQNGLIFGGRDVLPGCFVVFDSFDCFRCFGFSWFLRHQTVFPCAAAPATRSIILSNSLATFFAKSA